MMYDGEQEEVKQSVVSEKDKPDDDGKKARTRAKYISDLTKKPYGIAVLSVVALLKGAEAVSGAAKQVIQDSEKSGGKRGESGGSMVDREFWESVGESLNWEDTKASVQSLSKSVNEWSRTLGDAYERGSGDVKEDFDNAVANLSEWGELQGDNMKSLSDSLKAAAKPPPKKATTAKSKPSSPRRSRTDESAFSDIWNALQSRYQEYSESTSKRLEDSKAAAKVRQEAKAAKAGKTVKEAPADTTKQVKKRPVISLPFLSKKETSTEAAQEEKPVEKKTVVESPVSDATAAAAPVAAAATTDAKPVAVKKGPSAEELVKKSVGTPVIKTEVVKSPPAVKEKKTPAAPKPSSSSKPSVAEQDKSVAAMVDKMIADNKVAVAPSKPRPRRNIGKPASPPPPPTPVTPLKPVAAAKPTPSPAAKVPEKETDSKPPPPKEQEASRPILSTSSAEKTGPGTASFFRTGGSSVSGGMIGGSGGGMSVAGQDSGDKAGDKSTSPSKTTRRGLLGEELGRSTSPDKQAAPGKVSAAPGGGDGGSGAGGDGGSGGSGGSDGEEGDPKSGRFPFWWIVVVIACGAIAYKIYKDQNDEGPGDSEMQWSST